MDNRQSIDLIISDAFLPSDDGLLILKSVALALDFAMISRIITPKTYILASNSTWILDVFEWRSDVLEWRDRHDDELYSPRSLRFPDQASED